MGLHHTASSYICKLCIYYKNFKVNSAIFPPVNQLKIIGVALCHKKRFVSQETNAFPDYTNAAKNAHHFVNSHTNYTTSLAYSLKLPGETMNIIKIIALSCFSLHPDTTPPQPNHNVTPTHIEPKQHNPWHNSTNKSQAHEDGCSNIRNMLSIK